jgi:hypothetical protein
MCMCLCVGSYVCMYLRMCLLNPQVAEHTNAEGFAEAIARLTRDQHLWDTASKGAILHVARHFSGPRLEEDVRDLLLAAAKHRKDSF